MPGLLIALLVLLNIGGIITVLVNLGQGNPRWVTDLVTVAVLDVVGFYLLRLARQ